jgi:hypothetical protein
VHADSASTLIRIGRSGARATVSRQSEVGACCRITRLQRTAGRHLLHSFTLARGPQPLNRRAVGPTLRFALVAHVFERSRMPYVVAEPNPACGEYGVADNGAPEFRQSRRQQWRSKKTCDH